MDMTGYGDQATGLASDSPANPFDLLAPEEFEELQAAFEAASGSPAEESESVGDEASESEQEQAEEAAAGTELHTPEQMAAIAAEARDAIASCLEDLKAKLVEAEQNDDSDPKAIGKLLEQAEDALADAEEAVSEAEQAVGDEDVGAAAEATAECERLREEAAQLLADAAEHVGTPPEPEEKDAEESTPADKPKPAAPKVKAKPAMVSWAERG